MISKKKKLSIAMSVLLGLNIQNCAVHYGYIPQVSERRAEEKHDCNISYEKRSINPKIKTIKKEEKYTLEEIVFKSKSNSYKNKDFAVNYRSHNENNKPVIIFFTPIGRLAGYNNRVSAYFVKQGFDVASIKPKHGFLWHENDIYFCANLLKEIMDDTRVFMDWLEYNRNKTDFASVGISFSGISASLLAGIDSRIKAGAFAFSGGDLGNIIMKSKDFYLKVYRIMRMSDGNLTEEQFLDKINDACKCVDPLTYAHNINPKNFLVIYSAFDRKINPESAKKLHEAMGKPEMIKIYDTHQAIFHKRYVLKKIAEKLKKSWILQQIY